MRRRLSAAVTTGAVLALVGLLCVMHGDEVGIVLSSVPPAALAAAVALHVVTLVLRSEAWGMTLASAGADRLTRRTLHGANAAAFLAGSLQSQAALPARVTMLRRLAAEDAPPASQIWIADVPIVALELSATALLLAAAAVAGLAPWWIAVVAGAVAAAVLLAALRAPARFARLPMVRGLAVLVDRGRRGLLVAIVAGIATLTAARLWLILSSCGLPHGFGDVAWLFAAIGVFGALPLGPGGPSAATLATAGTEGIGSAVAAGLMIAASSILAVAGYALVVLVFARGYRSAARGA